MEALLNARYLFLWHVYGGASLSDGRDIRQGPRFSLHRYGLLHERSLRFAFDENHVKCGDDDEGHYAGVDEEIGRQPARDIQHAAEGVLSG